MKTVVVVARKILMKKKKAQTANNVYKPFPSGYGSYRRPLAASSIKQNEKKNK